MNLVGILILFTCLGQSLDMGSDPVLVEVRQMRVELQQYHIEVTKMAAVLTQLQTDVHALHTTIHGQPGKEGSSGVLSKQTKLEQSWTRHSRFLWGTLVVLGGIVGTTISASVARRLWPGKNGGKKR